MPSSSSDDSNIERWTKSMTRRILEEQWQGMYAWCWIVVPRKVHYIHHQTEIWSQILTLAALLLLSLNGAACTVTLVYGMLRTAEKRGRNCWYGLWSLPSRMVLHGGSTTIWWAILSEHDRACAQLDKIEHVASVYRALQVGHWQWAMQMRVKVTTMLGTHYMTCCPWERERRQ